MQTTMQSLIQLYSKLTQHLECLGDSIAPLVLRFILAWEFGEAGYQKLHGHNWFADISFPFPFNLLPASVNWNIATGFELIGATALLLGLATRFFSISLIILTIVAIATVHWPTEWHTLAELLKGYRIVDEAGDGFGNYKLPVLYLVMFIPLLLNGAGKLSLDNFIKKYINKQ